MDEMKTESFTNLLPLPRTNIVLMIFLYLITLTLYEPIWYIRRKQSINALLGSSKKIGTTPIILLIFSALQIIGTIKGDEITNLFWLASWGLSIVMAFRVKGIILDHFTSRDEESYHFSNFLTFLFRIFYLQYKINCLHKKIIT